MIKHPIKLTLLWSRVSSHGRWCCPVLPLPQAICCPEFHPGAPQLFRERVNPSDIFRPEQVQQKFHLWRAKWGSWWIGDELKPMDQRSHAIPATIKICAVLCFYTSGPYLDITGDVICLFDEPSLCVIVPDMMRALLMHWLFIKCPQAQDQPLIIRVWW